MIVGDNAMKIFIGADHRGLELKTKLIEYLKENGQDITDCKTVSHEGDDYPDFAYEVCQNVLETKGLGILLCGTGIGMSIAANKIKGIRCAKVSNENEAFLAKNHNAANVIALSYKLSFEEIVPIVDIFIVTKPASEERHLRRIEKITEIENGTFKL